MLFASFFWLLVIHALQKLRPWIRNLHEQPAPKASTRWSFLNKKQILLSLITTPFNKSFPSGSERNPRYHCLLRGQRKYIVHLNRRRLCCHQGSKLLDFLNHLPTSPYGKRIRWVHDSTPITWQGQVAFSEYKKEQGKTVTGEATLQNHVCHGFKPRALKSFLPRVPPLRLAH